MDSYAEVLAGTRARSPAGSGASLRSARDGHARVWWAVGKIDTQYRFVANYRECTAFSGWRSGCNILLSTQYF